MLGTNRARILLTMTVAVSNFARYFSDSCLKASASANALRELMAHARARHRAVCQLCVNQHTVQRKPLIRIKQPPGRFAFYQGAF